MQLEQLPSPMSLVVGEKQACGVVLLQRMYSTACHAALALGVGYAQLDYLSDQCNTVCRWLLPCTDSISGVHIKTYPCVGRLHCLLTGGQWLGRQAGGRSCHASWGSNPQHLISCQRETTALLALLRPDVANSLVPQPFDPRQCIGLTLAAPEVTAGGWGRRCCIVPGSSGRAVVHAESDFCTMDEAVLLVQLQPEVPYVLAPSTADPGEQSLRAAVAVQRREDGSEC
jgi:hypothetical protein